jgi:hypothetical protein
MRVYRKTNRAVAVTDGNRAMRGCTPPSLAVTPPPQNSVNKPLPPLTTATACRSTLSPPSHIRHLPRHIHLCPCRYPLPQTYAHGALETFHAAFASVQSIKVTTTSKLQAAIAVVLSSSPFVGQTAVTDGATTMLVSS